MGFILAATGSAIGLGNLWKFPFITWENGGGAFVLIYLMCIVGVGLPIMMAELMIGRKTQKSPVGALKEAMGPWWGWVGAWGVMAGFIILSYYSVVAGWSLFYFIKTVGWSISGFPPDMQTVDLFGEVIGNGGLQIGLSGLFMAATVGAVYFGVHGGIERVARISLPILFIILVLLLVSALTMEGSGEALGPQHLGPFVERQIAGDHRGATLVAQAEDLKQHLSSRFGQGYKAQLIDDQQRVACQQLLEA